MNADSADPAGDQSLAYLRREGTLGSYRIIQVAATGGATAIIPTRLANFRLTA